MTRHGGLTLGLGGLWTTVVVFFAYALWLRSSPLGSAPTLFDDGDLRGLLLWPILGLGALFAIVAAGSLARAELEGQRFLPALAIGAALALASLTNAFLLQERSTTYGVADAAAGAAPPAYRESRDRRRAPPPPPPAAGPTAAPPPIASAPPAPVAAARVAPGGLEPGTVAAGLARAGFRTVVSPPDARAPAGTAAVIESESGSAERFVALVCADSASANAALGVVARVIPREHVAGTFVHRNVAVVLIEPAPAGAAERLRAALASA